ncbi:permease [Paenibacillus albicereus]|uniref:Permease n=1 Tax=Paenibacillus albicereus TaxID=2726185 RepID=A0A6H2H3W0_9BACL|nr:permease [Paenibacillus albicereus]QJC54352.1 permease [Paenibacillus albicereus]
MPSRRPNDGRKALWLAVLFILIAAAGLTYIKWWPYYGKAIKAITEHTIGSSILTGGQEAIPNPSWQSAWDYAVVYYKAVWKAAVFGILLGSLVQVLLPANWLMRVLGQRTFRSTVWGGVASLPGMMCSCCAAPIAAGLRKKNVSVGAALAFWLGNPLLNPATLIFMFFVLGWDFTLLRLAFGLAITFGVSYLANRFAGEASVSEDKLPAEALAPAQADHRPFLVRWGRSLGTMLLNVIPAYILAVLLLGAARAWLFPTLGEGAGTTVLALLIFAIAGTLFVIPTAAEIPIVQSFLSLGYGGAAAGALLVTLPTVSLPSLLMLRRAFPARVLWLVFGSVVASGLLSGLIGAFLF